MTKSAIVKQVGDQWYLYTKDMSRVLGKHPSAKAAYAQEYAIQKSQESKEQDMNKSAFIKLAYADYSNINRESYPTNLHDVTQTLGDMGNKAMEGVKNVSGYNAYNAMNQADTDRVNHEVLADRAAMKFNLGFNQQPQPTPQAPSGDWLAKFRKSTGTNYNAHSKMDMDNMRRLQDQGGASTLNHHQYVQAGSPQSIPSQPITKAAFIKRATAISGAFHNMSDQVDLPGILEKLKNDPGGSALLGTILGGVTGGVTGAISGGEGHRMSGALKGLGIGAVSGGVAGGLGALAAGPYKFQSPVRRRDAYDELQDKAKSINFPIPEPRAYTNDLIAKAKGEGWM